MKFRDLLNLYKTGRLPEKEKPIVEEEIDKFEALSDYVFSEVSDVDVKEISNNNDTSKIQNINNADDSDTNESINSNGIDVSNSEEEDFSKNIKKHIRKAFMKMGAIVLVIVIAILLFIQFGLSPIVDSLYYNPTKEIPNTSGKKEYSNLISQQIELDFRIYSELRMPLEARNNATATPLGFGNYNVSFTQSVFRDGVTAKPSVGGYIKRGKIHYYDPGFQTESITINWFYSGQLKRHIEDPYALPAGMQDEDYTTARETFLESIEKYDEDKPLKVRIAFHDLTSFTQLIGIINKYNLEQTWAAVLTCDAESMFMNTLGFSFDTDGYYYSFDNKKYPRLLMQDDIDGVENENKMKQHFLSMLNYMSNQEKFLKMIDENMDEDINIYKSSYDYIKKNDMKFYAIATYISKKDAEKIVDDGIVHDIQSIEYGE